MRSPQVTTGRAAQPPHVTDDLASRQEHLLARALPGADASLELDPTWCVVVETSEDMLRVHESLLCLADGVIGTRGVLEEARASSFPVVVAGLYEPDDKVGERIAAVPSWCSLRAPGVHSSGRRVLDLRDGLLTREVRDGDRLLLRTLRFACAARPGSSVLVADLPADPFLVGNGSPVRTGASALYPTAGGGGVAVAMATTTSSQDSGSGRMRLDRVAAHVVSSRNRPLPDQAKRSLDRTLRVGTSRLLGEQRRVWRRRWHECDVEVVGDPEITLAARFALYHLLSSVGRHGEAAVGARGLTGTAYAGHVFWDTDVFVLPVLAAVDARAARAVLDYRVRRLDAARQRAQAAGRNGARYPWESAATGVDVTPRSGIDQHGEEVRISTGELEEHVSADVAWAAWRLATWTGDWPLLAGPGGSLVVETARYWASRVRRDAAGRCHIDGVTGPDEYHEHVNDNAFTNLMARWNLDRAADLVELGLRDDVDDEEGATWREVAGSLVDNYDPATGRYEQFHGFDHLELLDARDVSTPLFAADLALGADRLSRTQVIKQADVLMAHHLIPEGVASGSLTANLDHYLPRTAHGSSLSPAVHASLLARAGRPTEALEMLRLAASIDRDDLTETTAGGLHLANLAGIWQAIVHGFAGLSVRSPDDETLSMDPVMPEDWEELRFRVRWHGVHVACRIRHEGVEVTCDRPLAICVRGMEHKVGPPGGRVS